MKDEDEEIKPLRKVNYPRVSVNMAIPDAANLISQPQQEQKRNPLDDIDSLIEQQAQ